MGAISARWPPCSSAVFRGLLSPLRAAAYGYHMDRAKIDGSPGGLAHLLKTGTWRNYRVKDWDPLDFPALYRCADKASISAQRWYLRWVAINLGLLVMGATVVSVSPASITDKRVVHAIAAACFLLALATSLLLAVRRWERVWYSGRAVAESVKSLTWKFMMGADPYPTLLTPAEATERFTKTLRELLHENRVLSAALAGKDAGDEQITQFMTSIRGTAVGTMRDVYRAQRVEDQQAWYAREAERNRWRQTVWFVLLVVFQGCAVILAMYLVYDPASLWRGPGVFSSLASATVAWGQVRRFQELAQAYGFAAQELSLISARASHVQTREDLGRFVNDAETAISREHSSWIARRETL